MIFRGQEMQRKLKTAVTVLFIGCCELVKDATLPTLYSTGLSYSQNHRITYDDHKARLKLHLNGIIT